MLRGTEKSVLMLKRKLGDLALSIVTPNNADEGLFLREAYLSDSWELWRGLFILVTGVFGIYGYSYGMKGIRKSLDPGYRAVASSDLSFTMEKMCLRNWDGFSEYKNFERELISGCRTQIYC